MLITSRTLSTTQMVLRSRELSEQMEQTLATIGEKSFSLPEDPETAALAFLQKLTVLGYAEFAIDKGELYTQHPIAVSPVDDGKYMQNKP